MARGLRPVSLEDEPWERPLTVTVSECATAPREAAASRAASHHASTPFPPASTRICDIVLGSGTRIYEDGGMRVGGREGPH